VGEVDSDHCAGGGLGCRRMRVRQLRVRGRRV